MLTTMPSGREKIPANITDDNTNIMLCKKYCTEIGHWLDGEIQPLIVITFTILKNSKNKL